jgi:hypothetical protein
MEERWTCGECGWTNQGGRFCFECGRDGFPDPAAVQPLARPDDDGRRRRQLALVGSAIALLVIVVGGAALLLSGGDSKAPAKAAPAAVATPSKLTRAQTVDELMQIVIASHDGLAAARKGEWEQAARNRRSLVSRLSVLATRTDEIELARSALARALVASERANTKSLACKDGASVSACAAPAHHRATVLKERFRARFNKILAADGRDRIAANSF